MPYRLPTTEEKQEYVHKQFDRIARRYDFTNDVISLGMHRIWKRKAVNALSPKPGGIYLDVCCGSGDVALLIANVLERKGSVTGLDFSSNMLDVAKNRAASLALKLTTQGEWRSLSTYVNWVLGNAQEMPFADSSFDGAISSFGLRNLSNLPKGIGEMARVVRPGGKVINLDLGHPQVPVFTPLFLIYFGYLVPVIGQLLQNDRQAYTYLPQSLRTYPKPEGISQLFAEAKLRDIVHIPLALGAVAMHIGIKSGA